MAEEKRPEEMGAFFDVRSSGYDRHMKENVESCEEFYKQVVVPLTPTQAAVNILDIGCGTGLEFEGILAKAPNAQITGIDLSKEMLNCCATKFDNYHHQIRLVQGSYLTHTFEESHYDYVVSVMTAHHLLIEEKLDLYKKIYRWLKPGGKYIEGDYIVSEQEEQEFLDGYNSLAKQLGDVRQGKYHIDIPFSVATQQRLLREAGFSSVSLIWHQDKAAVFQCQK